MEQKEKKRKTSNVFGTQLLIGWHFISKKLLAVRRLLVQSTACRCISGFSATGVEEGVE